MSYTISDLKYRILPLSVITRAQEQRMFFLMADHYQGQQEAFFIEDLRRKNFVIAMCTPDDEIQGFSTAALNPSGTGDGDFHVLYSGDTIIHPDFWGTQELVKGFFHLVSSIHRCHPDKPLYWLLISKGHRTYMYLPLLYRRYFPGLAERHDASLFPLLDQTAERLFGPYWHPETGIVRLPHEKGMIEALTEASYKKQKGSEHVDFFLKCNPNFHEGDELACFIDLSPQNLLPLGERVYRVAMELPAIC